MSDKKSIALTSAITFLQCGSKGIKDLLARQSPDAKRRPATINTIVGNAVHHAIAKKPTSAREAMELAEYSADKALATIDEKIIDKRYPDNAAIVSRCMHDASAAYKAMADILPNAITEKEVVKSLGDEYDLTARIDLITNEGKVIEYTTSAYRPQTNDRKLLQGAMYQLMLGQHDHRLDLTHMNPQAMYIGHHWGKNDAHFYKTITATASLAFMNYAMCELNKIYALFNDELSDHRIDILKNESMHPGLHCNYCDHRDTCPAQTFSKQEIT